MNEIEGVSVEEVAVLLLLSLLDSVAVVVLLIFLHGLDIKVLKERWFCEFGVATCCCWGGTRDQAVAGAV